MESSSGPAAAAAEESALEIATLFKATMSKCLCAVDTRDAWHPRRDDMERVRGPQEYLILRGGSCPLSHKRFGWTLLKAMRKSKSAAALLQSLGAEHPAAALHASGLLKSICTDFDGDWIGSLDGRGCSADLVVALLALGANPAMCQSLNEWQSGVSRPYSLPAFAVSEAWDAVRSKGHQDCARAEEYIQVALALLRAGAPADAPAAVAQWAAPRAGVRAANGGVDLALMSFHGAPRMPTAPPCSTLHLTGLLCAWSKKARPLEGALDLWEAVLAQTPAGHRGVCPMPECKGGIIGPTAEPPPAPPVPAAPVVPASSS